MRAVAIDLGATSVKVILGTFEEGRLRIEEIARFKNKGVSIPKSHGNFLIWDLPWIFSKILDILESISFESLSFDSWGVDFALFDDRGRLISLPYHYRDERTKGVMNLALKKLDRKTVYRITGAQFMPINTVYQLYSMVLEDDPLLRIADKFLMIADTFNYWFSGVPVVEYTLSTTTQLFDLNERNWSREIAGKLGIPDIFPDVVESGTVLGRSRYGDFKIISSASHDTACAVVATPMDEDSVFISSGTWSIIGVELDSPILTGEALENDFANEGGYGGKIRFSKNVTGMWIIEECSREWKMDYHEILERASKIDVRSWIDPSYEDFFSPGNMVMKIKSFFERTGQTVLEKPEEIARSVFESMAFNYALTIEQLERLTGRIFKTVRIVGGGSRNSLLNQLTANVTGKVVTSGPHEATSMGNILIQLIAQGELSDLEETRKIVRNSFEIQEYHPEDVEAWKDRYETWKSKIGIF